MAENVLKIAVEGCCHGELDHIYKNVPLDTDLLIICGDFQSIRNTTDLQTINVPDKYKRLGDFHEYYKGNKTAPILTVFIGGNHECSSYLKELRFGGWVAPNIYFLGEFGCIWHKGIKIGGISGIYNRYSFSNNYLTHEKLPYSDKAIRSAYHVSPKNFMKMYLMTDNIDIMVSHDWPCKIEGHGDLNKLLKKKPFFKSDIKNGSLGSPLNQILLNYLKPKYWFSGHLHVKFEAIVKHDSLKRDKKVTATDQKLSKEKKYTNTDEISLEMDDLPTKNTSEIDLDMDDDISESQRSYKKDEEIISSAKEMEPRNNERIQLSMSEDEPTKHAQIKCRDNTPEGPFLKKRKIGGSRQTYFLALDKCLPRRNFLEFFNIPIDSLNHQSVNSDKLYYDPRTIAINRVIERFILKNPIKWQHLNVREFYKPEKCNLIDEFNKDINIEVDKLSDVDLEVPSNFEMTAPSSDFNSNDIPLRYWENNQTKMYCETFEIPYTSLN